MVVSATQEHEDGPLEMDYVVLHSSHFFKPQHVTEFGDRAFKNVTELKWGCQDGPPTKPVQCLHLRF